MNMAFESWCYCLCDSPDFLVACWGVVDLLFLLISVRRFHDVVCNVCMVNEMEGEQKGYLYGDATRMIHDRDFIGLSLSLSAS